MPQGIFRFFRSRESMSKPDFGFDYRDLLDENKGEKWMICVGLYIKVELKFQTLTILFGSFSRFASSGRHQLF